MESIQEAIAAFLENFCSNVNLDVLFPKKRKDEDEEVLRAVLTTKVKRAKIENYVLEVIPKYTDLGFKSHFRLSRSSVEGLMEILPRTTQSTTGRPALTQTNPETGVLLSLWLMGNQESFRGVADRFGLGQGHAYREFINFCTQASSLRSELIKWPKGQAAIRTLNEFAALREFAFPDVIGCLDGAHVCISAPKLAQTSYYNRKRFTSVVLQGVCDAKLQFIDVFAGWPGSSHDARVWKNSRLCMEIEKHNHIIPDSAHILGDSAYPLSTYLMTPYKDNAYLTRKERIFNKTLSSTRVVIEQAFGQLFGRFRRLKHILMFRMDRIPLVVITGCILHNYCIKQGDDMPDEDVGDDFTDWSFDDDDDDDGAAAPTQRNAMLKRDGIANYLLELHNVVV